MSPRTISLTLFKGNCALTSFPRRFIFSSQSTKHRPEFYKVRPNILAHKFDVVFRFTVWQSYDILFCCRNKIAAPAVCRKGKYRYLIFLSHLKLNISK